MNIAFGFKGFKRRMKAQYNFKKYGICPIHLVLCRPGGGYELNWICDKCDAENRIKHEDRIDSFLQERLAILAELKKSGGV